MALTVKVCTKDVDVGRCREALHEIIKKRLSKTQCTDEEIMMNLAWVKGNLPVMFKGHEAMVKREIDRWYRMDRRFMKIRLGVIK